MGRGSCPSEPGLCSQCLGFPAWLRVIPLCFPALIMKGLCAAASGLTVSNQVPWFPHLLLPIAFLFALLGLCNGVGDGTMLELSLALPLLSLGTGG